MGLKSLNPSPHLPLFFSNFLYAVASTISCSNEFHISIKKLCGKSIFFCLSLIISFGASLFFCCERAWKWFCTNLLPDVYNFVVFYHIFFMIYFYNIRFSFTSLLELCQVVFLKKPKKSRKYFYVIAAFLSVWLCWKKSVQKSCKLASSLVCSVYMGRGNKYDLNYLSSPFWYRQFLQI